MPLHSKTDVFILKLNIFILKLMGLAPMSISIKKSSLNDIGRSFSCNYSWSGVIYNICLTFTVSSIAYLSMPGVYRTEYPHKTQLTMNIDVTLALVGNIVAVTLIIIFSYRQKCIVDMLNEFISIDSNFSKLFDCNKYEQKQCQSIILFWTNIFYCIYVITTHLFGFWKGYVSLFTLIFPTTLCGCVITQYTLITSLIGKKFTKLNENLKKLLEILAKFENHSYFDNCIAVKLFAIRRERSRLCTLTSNVSEFFGLPLLFTISYFSGALIYSSFFAIRPFIVLMSPFNESLSATVNTLAFILIIVLPIIALCILVTRISLEMDKTSDITRKLLIEFQDNEILKSELQEFFLELLHTNVQFTAYNIFPLDCSLLYSIFGMLATYLVILAQVSDYDHSILPFNYTSKCIQNGSR